MPATSFTEYAREIGALLNMWLETGLVSEIEWYIDQRSALRGFIAGRMRYVDSSELHFREFVDLTCSEPKLMYSYHYQDSCTLLRFRYDNAIHRPPLAQRAHKHTPTDVILAATPTLAQVLEEISAFFDSL